MKKLSLFLLFALVLLLTACGPKEPETEEPPPPEEPLRLEALAVEIGKNGLSPQELASAVQELPEVLRAGFAAQDVEIGQVTVTVGTSPAATAQALAEGTLDLAFLPAEDLLLYGGEAQALLIQDEETENDAAQLAAVSGQPDLTDGRFAAALAEVLAGLEPDRMEALGAVSFRAVTEEDLDAVRQAISED